MLKRTAKFGIRADYVLFDTWFTNAPKPLKVKLLFVRDRNNSNKTLCLLFTDLSLFNEDIIVTYAKRWNIEVMFKNQKQHLRLVSTSCSRKYSSIITNVT